MSDFSGDLQAFADRLNLRIATVLQVITLDLWNRITQKTPVDTGRARAGWGVAIGVADIATPPPGDYGPPSAPDVGAIDGTQVIYILNNVDYVQYLEEGSSQQAPAGMVRISIAEVELEVEAILLQLG